MCLDEPSLQSRHLPGQHTSRSFSVDVLLDVPETTQMHPPRETHTHTETLTEAHGNSEAMHSAARRKKQEDVRCFRETQRFRVDIRFQSCLLAFSGIAGGCLSSNGIPVTVQLRRRPNPFSLPFSLSLVSCFLCFPFIAGFPLNQILLSNSVDELPDEQLLGDVPALQLTGGCISLRRPGVRLGSVLVCSNSLRCARLLRASRPCRLARSSRSSFMRVF